MAVLHATTYKYDRGVALWNVFVPQSARESIRRLPYELALCVPEENHLPINRDERSSADSETYFEASSVRPVLDILEHERCVVVIGDPGSGKTSLLKYQTLRWTRNGIGPLPLWVELKDYARDRKGVLAHLESGCGAFHLDAREIEKHLDIGDAAIYFDGLDEIFDAPARGSIVEELCALASRYQRASMVVTSRTGHELGRLCSTVFTPVTLENLDDTQISNFLNGWHLVADDDAKEQSRLSAKLQQALHDSRAIRDLAGNPLLLTMLAILNRTQDLPRDRVDLYREASRVLLHEWDSSRCLPLSMFGRHEKEAILRGLAGVMQKGEAGLAGNLIDRPQLLKVFREVLESLGIPDWYPKAQELIQVLTERNFMLCRTGADTFSFVHRTFLEYFCADWFVERVRQTLSMDVIKDLFLFHWKDENWHEVLRLIAGLVTAGQADELIRLLLAQDGRLDKQTNLILAAGCLSEVRRRYSILQTDQELWARYVVEVICYAPPGPGGSVFDGLKPLGDMAAFRNKAIAILASTWPDARSRGWLRSSAEWDTDSIVRQAAIREFVRGSKRDAETFDWLCERIHCDRDSNVQMGATQELTQSWKESPVLPSWLKQHARSDEHWAVREAAVGELARGWRDDPETLPLLLEIVSQDESQFVRVAAVREVARGWKGDLQIHKWLKEQALDDTNDTNPHVRSAAVEELARGWKEELDTLPLIRDRARHDNHQFVRTSAVTELARGWGDHPETLPFARSRALGSQ